MSGMTIFIELAYIYAAGLFIYGLKKLSSPLTARRGNQLAAIAMLIGIVVTLFDQGVLNYTQIFAAIVIGGGIGAIAAKKVKMTSMPEMVAIFNGFGGAASAVVAASEFLRLTSSGAAIPVDTNLTIQLSTLIGTVTLTGSIIAWGKLAGWVPGPPITYTGQQIVNSLIFLGIIAAIVMLVGAPEMNLYWAFAGVALLLGILLVIPIGGADMPVVISLLNSYSGLAAAMTGFVLNNEVLIVAGALVGASGLILTKLMCVAMNRSLGNVLFGAFGKAPEGGAAAATEQKTVTRYTPEDGAMVLTNARSVIVVPGYGLAVAQAQHDVRELADQLEARGVEVKYAIHPVAGRMPGHMNVLLAEAKVPYDKLKDLDEINPEFEHADVALVIGANDVTNPVSRTDENSPIYGMPILNCDKAQSCIILKRSLSPGFAAIDNPLFYSEKTMMIFGSAKDTVVDLVTETKKM
jgi:H+-translocating NAD(P) transhydrogenase subunit beta